MKKKKIVGIILLLGLVIGAGVVWGLGNTAKLSDKVEGKSEGSLEKAIVLGESKELSEGIVSYQTPQAHISLENQMSRAYVDNELYIGAAPGVDKEMINKLVSSLNGEVRGQTIYNNSYTIVLPKRYSELDMGILAEKLQKENSELLELVLPQVIMVPAQGFIPNDAKWGQEDEESEWSNSTNASGRNWGVEAINAPILWDYYKEMTYVDVGVLDVGFYEKHEDLIFSSVFKNEGNEDDHGTHVAGIMSAVFDNDRGIAGVAPKTTLHGASYKGIEGYLEQTKNETISHFETALIHLISVKKCKVVNISMAYDIASFAASRGNSQAKEDLDKENKRLKRTLSWLAGDGLTAEYQNEFVIIKAAGNQNDVKQLGGNYRYKRDSKERYGYKKHLKGKEYGDVDANYDVLSAIGEEAPELRDKIIVVGAAGKNGGGFIVNEMSNRGARVDVVAPGTNIYSTTIAPNKYGEMSGTSMAAPYVSGLAAGLFALDETLTGKEVKQLILDTATLECGYENAKRYPDRYKLIDAGAAARALVTLTVPYSEEELTAKIIGRWENKPTDGAERYMIELSESVVKFAKYQTGTSVGNIIKQTWNDSYDEVIIEWHQEAIGPNRESNGSLKLAIVSIEHPKIIEASILGQESQRFYQVPAEN